MINQLTFYFKIYKLPLLIVKDFLKKKTHSHLLGLANLTLSSTLEIYIFMKKPSPSFRVSKFNIIVNVSHLDLSNIPSIFKFGQYSLNSFARILLFRHENMAQIGHFLAKNGL